MESLRICPDRIEADKQVTRDLISFRIIEGDDIRVIIVLEILAVYLQDLLVRAEDVTDIACLLPVGIGVFRASGAMDFIIQGVRFGIASIGLNTDFVEALPTMLMKPLSGSGARGMMLDAMNTYGADSFVGRLSSIVQGSCDTTFYVVALYYGSVGIRNTRYTVQCALLADLAGAIAAIAMAYLFF